MTAAMLSRRRVRRMRRQNAGRGHLPACRKLPGGAFTRRCKPFRGAIIQEAKRARTEGSPVWHEAGIDMPDEHKSRPPENDMSLLAHEGVDAIDTRRASIIETTN